MKIKENFDEPKFLVFNNSENDWDNLLFEENYHYRQLFCWGEYQKNKGNKVIRLLLKDKNIFTPIQIIHKKFINLHFLYIPGGIPKNFLKRFDYFIKFLNLEFKIKIFYLRIDSNYFSDHERIFLLKENFFKSKVKTNNSLSLILKIDKNINFNSYFSKKWSHNLRRSIKKNTKIFINKEIDFFEFKRVIKDFNQTKKVNLTIEINQFKKIIDSAKNKICLITAYDKKNHLIGFKSFFYYKNDSWDFFTCTSKVGRSNLAGYLMLYTAFDFCRKNNINRYFLGAYDENKYPGVSYFKKETGAEIFEYEGEWEISNSNVYLYFINLLLLIYIKMKKFLF